MISFSRLSAVARKEFIHILRDWRSLFLSLAIPVILIVIFGYALTLDLRNVPTVVWDQSKSKESRELISLFSGSPYFHMVGDCDNYPRAVRGHPAGPGHGGRGHPRRFFKKDPFRPETQPSRSSATAAMPTPPVWLQAMPGMWG